LNEEAILSVAAHVSDGGTLSYQWLQQYLGQQFGGASVSGATSSSYSAPTDTAGTKYYYCTVTNTLDTDTASTSSDPAKVVVATREGSGEDIWDGTVASTFGGGSGASSDHT